MFQVHGAPSIIRLKVKKKEKKDHEDIYEKDKKKANNKKGVKAQSRSHLETPALRLLSVTRMRSVCVAFILALSLPEQNILH